MFEAAGFPAAAATGWTDQMPDSDVVCGEGEGGKEGERIFDMGASEAMASVVSGPGRSGRKMRGEVAAERLERTVRLLAQLSDS